MLARCENTGRSTINHDQYTVNNAPREALLKTCAFVPRTSENVIYFLRFPGVSTPVKNSRSDSPKHTFNQSAGVIGTFSSKRSKNQPSSAHSPSQENALQPSSPKAVEQLHPLLVLRPSSSPAPRHQLRAERLAQPPAASFSGRPRPLAPKLSNSEFPDASPSPLVVGVESSPAPSLPPRVKLPFCNVNTVSDGDTRDERANWWRSRRMG